MKELNKNIKPKDLRRLNALVIDEDEASKEYAHMSKQFEYIGDMHHAQMFKEMSDDEAGHRDNIIALRREVKKMVITINRNRR